MLEDGEEKESMACFERVSPALREILLKLYRAEKAVDFDHHLYEFGSVEYHIESSAADPQHKYLSIATPLLSQGLLLASGLSTYTKQMVQDACSDVVEIVEPQKEGYQLTLRLNFAKIPRGKDFDQVIRKLSSVQAVILSSQLKEMLQNVNSQDIPEGMYKPIKLVYHPREPFYVIRQPEKIIAVFPIRFREQTDVIIATAFFQELMDVGSSAKWAKAPACTWSPIPPPELRGEPLEDLSTNGGFVSFAIAYNSPPPPILMLRLANLLWKSDISFHHVEGIKLDRTVWSLLNFYAYIKNHVKCTRGFIQRRMQKRLDILVEVLKKANSKENEHVKEIEANAGRRAIRKLVSLSKLKTLKHKCGDFTRRIKQIRFRVKIHGFKRFRRRWLTLPKFSSAMGYTRLE
ncbi:hypothetical protein K2173_021502 [Erythroxylum novogranatense]|uniref:Arp2/3 complex 34 kDa subunit n=1 Tax=Erythroxylum novogranatense TaxID=1862640 RepID=A0AAV8TQH4_9ROSI|nr:hypothetical protein K2173_021502 [Erythroxylum novogranatense]